jgi:DDHD domain
LNVNACVDVIYAKNVISPVLIPRTLDPPHPTGISHAASLLLPSVPTSTATPVVIELETHDLDKEARAERLFQMMNENGGLDYVLSPIGVSLTGLLDMEYVSMLGAHVGYWERKDFARMILVETGREAGKTVEWLRVPKRRAEA